MIRVAAARVWREISIVTDNTCSGRARAHHPRPSGTWARGQQCLKCMMEGGCVYMYICVNMDLCVLVCGSVGL
jgi:hypothetical protein